MEGVRAVSRLLLRARADSTPLVGLDPGSRYVGLAVSAADLRLAVPGGLLDRADRRRPHADVVHSFLTAKGARGVVVGLPLSLEGRENAACHAVRRYVKGLKLGPGIGVAFFDERFSTAIVRDGWKRLGASPGRLHWQKDVGAACVILQTALDAGQAFLDWAESSAQPRDCG